MRIDPTSLYVVETTDGSVFLGRVALADDVLTVRSGLVGRPAVLPIENVEELVLASEHPHIEMVA